MTLNEEIQHLLSGYSVPDELSRQMAATFAEVELGQIAPGIEVGETAPDFELDSSAGSRVRLSERVLAGPVVLTFFRGAWCSICNLQVMALQRALPEILARGASVLGVHSDSESFDESPGEGFDILRDWDQSVIRSYRLQLQVPPEAQIIYTGVPDFNLSSRTGDGSWSLPLPGTFVVDRNRIVRRRHVTPDFTVRMEPDEVIAALDEIGED